MQRVVVATVFEFRFNRSADAEPQGRINGDITLVEQAMNIGPQRYAIYNYMALDLSKRPYVSRVKCGQRPLARHCAAALIRVDNAEVKAALTQARGHEVRFTKHCADRLIRCGPERRSLRQSVLNGGPKRESVTRGEIVRLSGNNLARKILRRIDDLVGEKKYGCVSILV